MPEKGTILAGIFREKVGILGEFSGKIGDRVVTGEDEGSGGPKEPEEGGSHVTGEG